MPYPTVYPATYPLPSSLFHIAAADGSGVEAWWNTCVNYTKPLIRYTTSVATAAGPMVHQTAIPDESDREINGNGGVLPDYINDLEAINSSNKTLWEFSDGTNAWRVRIATWVLTPSGGGVYTLNFKLLVVSKIK